MAQGHPEQGRGMAIVQRFGAALHMKRSRSRTRGGRRVRRGRPRRRPLRDVASPRRRGGRADPGHGAETGAAVAPAPRVGGCVRHQPSPRRDGRRRAGTGGHHGGVSSGDQCGGSARRGPPASLG
jgi:hypothetical protein